MNTTWLTLCYRDKNRVAERVMEKQKDKSVIGQVYIDRFSWGEMIDALADVYLGVRCIPFDDEERN